jgi:hypothetical protein
MKMIESNKKILTCINIVIMQKTEGGDFPAFSKILKMGRKKV